MALNPFFLQGSPSEQRLVQDLINEQLGIYGVEVTYIPRKFVNRQTIIEEVQQSKYDDNFSIEAYVNTYEGYGGQGDIMTKFGMSLRDELTLTISRERFEDFIGAFLTALPDDEIVVDTRPREGDLVYFPLGDRLFEIKYVEHEQPFYQLKKTYVYQLRCELFRYEDEVIDTGIDTIDDEVEQLGYIQTLSLIGAAVTATATATYVASGAVDRITIKNVGTGYKSSPQPLVAISSAPDSGISAVGFASISNTFIDCDTGLTDGKIVAINLSNAGSGYTEAPMITIQDPDGTGVGAAATAGITTIGSIGVVSIVSGGSGYTTSPSFTVTGSVGVGTSARGIGLINASGIVTAAYITNAGSGYTAIPTITFDAPTAAGSGIGTGSYIFNEIIEGQTSGATARVKEWNATTNKLEISGISSNFHNGEQIIGQNSGAKFAIFSVNTDDEVSGFAENDVLQTESDSILDFSETNPFGMP